MAYEVERQQPRIPKVIPKEIPGEEAPGRSRERTARQRIQLRLNLPLIGVFFIIS